jgi:hypothetical protein
MLERRELLLRPRSGPGMQTIADGQTGVAIGMARWMGGNDRPWWRWFRATHLSVYEADDQPLLFTVRRSWGPWRRTEVCDADERPIGTLHGPVLRDSLGRTLALMERAGGVFRGRSGEELARLVPGPEGARLLFHPDLLDPFLKMLLLAAALGGGE